MPTVPLVDLAFPLRQVVSQWRQECRSVALVPTRRTLHEGHLSLVRLARQQADRIVVSVFAAPGDLAPNEEVAAAPQALAASCEKLSGLADLVFAPTMEEMFPAGDCTKIVLSGPAAVGLEDRFSPAHFENAATVAAKLLNTVQPDIAVMGEKDYQELLVVRRMVEDLLMPVRVLSGPTLREKGGLAGSACNHLLSPANRAHATILYQTLTSCAEGIRDGDAIADVLEAGWAVLSKAGFKIDYLEARDAGTLAPVSPSTKTLRLLVAARLGATRLIDNVEI